MADPAFRLFDPVSWPITTRARSSRHLVGFVGDPRTYRGARAMCGKVLPPGTATDTDEARTRCRLCWRRAGGAAP